MRYSFDVFDTLITRKTATPKGIFALMQKQLLQDRGYASIPLFIRENFYRLRIDAEELARYHLFLQGKGEEVTLEEIYQAFRLTGSITEEDIEKLQKLELEMEYACSVPIEENIKRLKELYLSSHMVVLISDMYLSAETIRWILVKQDDIFKEIKIFVSSQYRKQKGSGALFCCVKQEEKWDEKEWVHIGDQEAADKKGAEKIGICAEVYPYPPFFEFEKKFLELSEAEAGLQLAIGTARNLRIGTKKGIAYQMGVSFGGNLLVPYVQWVILESIRKGIKHLYFIARDGYLLQQVADLIIEKKAYPIKTSYLYGSRKAWRMACFSKEKTDIGQLISFTDFEERSSIGQIAQIFQVLPEELESFIELQPDYPVWKIREIAKILNTDKKFRAFLEKKHAKKKEWLKQYLLQEIDFTEKAAFVEVSGSGMTQVLLGGLLEEMGYASLPTYFMRITTTMFVKDQIWVYMPRFFYHGYLVEAFCRALHGQTIGYQEKEGKVIPLLDQKEVGLMEAYGYREYMEGVCQFAKSFLERVEEGKVSISTEKIYMAYMEYLSTVPEGEVLEFIGELPLEVTGESKEARKLAPCLSEEEIEKLFLIRSYEPLNWFYQGGNIECSINRCSEEQKEKIKYYQLHKNTYLGNMAKKKYHGSLAPFLEKPAKMGKKVALYGAGIWGQKYYWRIQDTCEVEVVAWVDKAYKKYKGNGLEIKEISVLKECLYDQILICVKDQLAVEKIREELVGEGLEPKKIYWVQEICG